MKNLDSLKAHLEAMPEDLKSNALDLMDRMTAVIEGIGDEPVEWRMPYMRLFQAMSSREGLPRGVAPGDLILGEQVMEAPINFIPIRVYEKRQFWSPDLTEKKMLCQSPDAILGQIGKLCKECVHSVWVEGQGVDCNKVHTVVAISADMKELFSIDFAKTQFKVGGEFKNTLKKAGVVPYARVYGLSSETNPTTKTVEQFKIEALAADKRRTPEALIPFLKALFESISEDRKDLLTAFYKSIEDRRAAGLLPNGVPGTPQIENSAAAPGDATLQIPVEEKAAEAKVAPGAMKYKV